MDFCHLQEKNKKQLLNTRVDAVKVVSKQLVHKACAFIGNKIADAVTNSNAIKF